MLTSDSDGRKMIGPYLVHRALGRGANGTVYEVQQCGSDQHEALKLISRADSEDVTYRPRFEREVQMLSGIRHPNVVSVFNHGEEDGRLWLTMELVDGPDASKLLRERGPMPLNTVADIVTGTAAALDHVWQSHGITHRDVKPGNILLRLDGDWIVAVKLADFGIAKHAGLVSELTKTNVALGTSPYVSPESLFGLQLDGRADQYSLGCTAFTLLTGRPPFGGTTEMQMLSGHMYSAPPRVTELRPDLPSQLDAVFARVLAKNPGDRYASCREFAAALHQVLWSTHNSLTADGAPAAPASPPKRSGTRNLPRTRPVTRKRALIAAGSVAVIGIAGAGAVAGVRWYSKPAYKPITELAQLMPPAAAVTSAMHTTVAVTDPVTVTDSTRLTSPTKCAWYVTGSLPNGPSETYRSTTYTGDGLTVRVEMIRTKDTTASKIADVWVDSPSACPLVKVVADERTDDASKLIGEWLVKSIGQGNDRTTVATRTANPVNQWGDAVTGNGPTSFARSLGVEGTLLVSAGATRSTGPVTEDDAKNAAALVQLVLDRAAGR